MEKRIELPLELFQSLPVNEADKLQEELMSLYYKKNPDILQQIIAVSDNDEDILELKREEKFMNAINKDYAFHVDVLRKRNEDKIAKALVNKIDEFNANLME